MHNRTSSSFSHNKNTKHTQKTNILVCAQPCVKTKESLSQIDAMILFSFRPLSFSFLMPSSLLSSSASHHNLLLSSASSFHSRASTTICITATPPHFPLLPSTSSDFKILLPSRCSCVLVDPQISRFTVLVLLKSGSDGSYDQRCVTHVEPPPQKVLSRQVSPR